MMTKVKANMEIFESGDVKILYSYSVPVAAYTPAAGLVQTDIEFDEYTTRHIAAFLNGAEAATVAQEIIDEIEAQHRDFGPDLMDHA